MQTDITNRFKVFKIQNDENIIVIEKRLYEAKNGFRTGDRNSVKYNID